MKKIGIFYGSTMGTTEKISKILKDRLNKLFSDVEIDIYNVESATDKDMEKYNFIIWGTSTWGYGDLQDDWNTFISKYGIPNLYNKTIAIFGLGDQLDHYDVFVNAIGILHNIAEKGGANVIGYFPTDGYSFGNRTTAVKNNMFLGLALDEVNQAKHTDERIDKWLEQISKHFI